MWGGPISTIFLSLLSGLLGFVSLPPSCFLLVLDVRLFSFSSAFQLCVFCLNSVLINCSQFCVLLLWWVCISKCLCVCVCVCVFLFVFWFSFSVSLFTIVVFLLLGHEWVELCVVVVLLGCLGFLLVLLLVCYAVCVGLVEVFLLCVALLTAGVFFFFFSFFVWLR